MFAYARGAIVFVYLWFLWFHSIASRIPPGQVFCSFRLWLVFWPLVFGSSVFCPFGLLVFGSLIFGLSVFCSFRLLVFLPFGLSAFDLLAFGLLAFGLLVFCSFGLLGFSLYVGLSGCGLRLLFCWFADLLVWICVRIRPRIYIKTASKS